MAKQAPKKIDRIPKYLIICVLAIILIIFLAFGYIRHQNDQPKQLQGPLHPMVGCQKLQDGQIICM